MNCQILKSNIRKEKIAERMLLSTQEQASLSKQICFRAFKNFFLVRKQIGIYMPVKNEVDPRFLLNDGILFTSIPFIKNNDMIFKRWRKEDALVESAFKIPSTKEEAENIMPEIVIVPLVAFDGNCNRIGYGKGYYDKFLANYNGISIGFAYELQKVAKIEPESFDIKLDYIITEKEIYE